MKRIAELAARLATLVVLSATLYYFIDDSVFISEDNKKSLKVCKQQVEKGCPLLLEALDTRTIEVHLLMAKVKQLESDLQTLSSCPISLPQDGYSD